MFRPFACLVCLVSVCMVCWGAEETQEPLQRPAGNRVEPQPEPKSPPEVESSSPGPLAVEQVVQQASESVVVIRVAGRDGRQSGIGTGFVVSDDGLIATNLHVIGEARPITVEFADGRRSEVIAIEATDRAHDLAIIRVAEKELVRLALGDSSAAKPGQAVVALGNPQGLEHSVVSGVISGRREVEGMPMLQLAIPIEPGNSGGPLVDMHGRVLGVVTMKSAVTENLGFALEVNALRPLLERPNPVPIARWLTIGALDPNQWQPLFGARWRQRAGRISVEGAGTAFGGRSLCLWQREVPQLPFEVAVAVKLDDEAGAAGLVFYCDGSDRHYGFYPSGGKLRFSRFDGPNVLHWQVLEEVASTAYRPGQWNRLKVRLEPDRIQCFVNDELAITSRDKQYAAGSVGLAKFRETVAEFRGFQIGSELPDWRVPDEVARRIDVLLGAPPETEAILPDLVTALVPNTAQSTQLLRERAALLDQQADALRELAVRLHRIDVLAELERLLSVEEKPVELLRAALLVARLDNEEIDVDAYLAEVDRMARHIEQSLPDKADAAARLAALNRFLFDELGFHGSRGDYYHRANSYLNEVIDDREGLPLTLSVLYVELGSRLGLKLEGVGLPGHFVVRHVPPEGTPQLIDVFDRGRIMQRREAAMQVLGNQGRPLETGDLAATPPRAIVARMLRNLLGVALRQHDDDQILHDLDALLLVDPAAAQERSMRAVLLFRAGRLAESRADVDWLLDHAPEGLDIQRLLEFRRQLAE